MKKPIASILALVAINASAYTVTNTVTVVSNIYNRIGEEHWITNNIKNTHVNYYYTNNVYTVTNKTLLVSQQNFVTNTTVNLDVSQQAIADARAQANRAEINATNALNFANAAARSATESQGHSASAKDYMDEAGYYAQQAEAQVGLVESAGNAQVSRVVGTGNSVIDQINGRQQWFDDHFGQMVTNVNVDVNITTNINIYFAEDATARAMAETNKNDIAKLNEKIEDVKAEGSNLIEYSNAKKYSVLLTLTTQGIQATTTLGTFSAGSKYIHQDSEYVYSLYGTTNMNFGVDVSSFIVLDMGANKYPTVYFRNSYGESVNVTFPVSSSMMLPKGQSDSTSIYVDRYGTKTQGSIKVVYSGIATDKFNGIVSRYVSADLGIYNSLTGLKEDDLARLSMLNYQFLALSNWVESVFQKK